MIPYWHAYAFGAAILVSGVLALWKSEPLSGLRTYGSLATQAGIMIIGLTVFFQIRHTGGL